VALPQEKNQVRQTLPENLIISVNKSGQIFLFDTPMKDAADLRERLKKFSVLQPQPEVHIRGDAQSDFAAVGQVMNAVQRAGIAKVGFITDPGN
jgi:biopolymer transport protein ExbD